MSAEDKEPEDKKVIDLLRELGPTSMDASDWFTMAPPDDLSDVNFDDRRKQTLDAVDLRFADQMEAHREPPPTFRGQDLEVGVDKISSFRQQAGFAFEVVRHQQPYWLSESLEKKVPQAILRDLHRPVLDFPLRILRMEIPGTQGAWQTREWIDEAMRFRLELPPALHPEIEETADKVRAYTLTDAWESFACVREQRAAKEKSDADVDAEDASKV